MKILVGCEMSGRVRDAFIAQGHDAISCDILHTRKHGPHIIGDLLEVIKSQHWDMGIFFPPCTFLSNVSNPHKHQIWRQKEEKKAIQFVDTLWNCNIKYIAIENPVGVLSTKWKKWTQIIHPYWFGHLEEKKTCLWLKNLPPLESTNNVELQMRMLPKNKRQLIQYYKGPINIRSMIRSLTYQGVANAMAKQWSNLESD